jgi:hypothetical protein
MCVPDCREDRSVSGTGFALAMPRIVLAVPTVVLPVLAKDFADLMDIK